MPVINSVIAAGAGIALVVAAALAGPAGAPEARPGAVPLLWKVSDANTSVYLLGSFHLLKADDYPLPQEVESAFADAERVAFEVSPEELADPALAKHMLAAAQYSDGSTLSAVLPAPVRDKFSSLLESRGATLAQFETFEPWFVNLTLVMGLSSSMGLSAEHGLDRHVMQKAADAGKPTSGLETIAAQMSALDSAPIQEQVDALSDFVDDPERARSTIGQLHAAWRSGDAEQLDRLTRVEMLRETPQTYKVINVDRNRAWLPQINEMLAHPEDDALVVVGAMHLLGEDGLVEQMRAQGHRVERICTSCKSGTYAEKRAD